MIYGLGMLESGITFDYGQLLIDCEIARMIKYAVNGFRVNDDTLAVDVIRQVGASGNFLCHQHTLNHMRNQSHPQLINRTVREKWEKNGSLTMHQKALLQVRKILEIHQPSPLPLTILQSIRTIVTETEKELKITPTQMPHPHHSSNTTT